MLSIAPPLPLAFLPAEDDASRRQFLGIVVAAGLLTACSAEDDGGAVASPSGDYPRSVRTVRGEAVLEAEPQRVVAKYFSSEFDAVYVLGVVPVAVVSGFTEPFPWHDRAAQDVATLAPATLESVEWDVEAVAAERPDLIICQDGEYDKAAEQLEQLAPCLVFDANLDPSWRSDTRLAGEAFARETDAEAAIAETEAVIAEARQRVAALAGRTVRILQADAPYYYTRAAPSLLGKLVVELGLAVPDTEDYVALAEERLGDLGGTDLLLVTSYDDSLADQAVRGAIFGLVPQVLAGTWARLDAITAAGASTSALSIRYAAPLLADALLSAAGEGAGQRF